MFLVKRAPLYNSDPKERKKRITMHPHILENILRDSSKEMPSSHKKINNCLVLHNDPMFSKGTLVNGHLDDNQVRALSI